MSLETVSSTAIATLTALVGDLTTQSKKLKVSGPIDKLRIEADRQEIAARIAESQARVAQELAIARRIETAVEVEMEEFYDYAIDGKVGVEANGAKVSAGAGGSNKRVSRRIYRFKGAITG